MNDDGPAVLEDLRLPGLFRRVCGYAGLPPSRSAGGDDRFVLRSGPEPPDFLAKVLEEAFVEDEAEVAVWRTGDEPDYGALGPGGLAVRPGFDAPCPDPDALRRAAAPGGGRVSLIAVERRDAGGRLVGVTWAAVPEGEPPPAAEFRAAVMRVDADESRLS
jgi:hypothetical protein